MSRFIALLNASDPDLLTNIENAGGQVVSVSEPGVVIIDGDQTVADAVAQLQAVQAVGPVDATWDTSELSLGSDVGILVSAWNTGLSPEYQAALSDPYRNGEAWDTPGGCDPTNLGDGGDGGQAVADNGGGTGTGDGTTGTGDGTTGTGTGTTGTGDGTVASGDGTTSTGDGTTGTGDGTTGTGDGTGGQVASNDPPADGGWGDGWDTGGTGDGSDGGGQA